MQTHAFLDCLMMDLYKIYKTGWLYKTQETEHNKIFIRILKCKYLNFPLLYILFRIVLNYTVLYF